MKKFVDKCRPLALAVGLLAAGGAVAQVVTVPAGCIVRVPGTGGNATQVGNGGVVEMTDPFDFPGAAGNFVFTGATPVGWQLKGDISEQTTNVQAGPPPGAFPPDQSATGTTVNIESYNKFVRTAELLTPTTNARSKGQVTIEYTNQVCPGVFCNSRMSFDILKNWGNPATITAGVDYAPPIVGPNCWGTGLITFSVDQVSSDNGSDAIGYDQYYWNITNGLPTINPNHLLGIAAFNNTADDKSSITINQSSSAFTTWLAANPTPTFTIRACYGRYNPWNLNAFTTAPIPDNYILTTAAVPQTCRTKTMNAAQVNPNFTYTNSPCVPWNTTSFSGTYTAVGGHIYTWTSSCGWVLTPGVGTLAVSGMNNNPCILTLTDVGPCGTFTYNYTVNRNLTGIQPTIAGLTTACVPPLPSVGSSFTVQLPAGAQGNCTNWTISPVPSPAWTFVDANVNLRSVRTYTIPAGTCPAAYTITAASCTCPGNSLGVTVNVKPNNPTLSGPACVPFNVNTPLQVYNASIAPCTATSYTWSNTLGMTPSPPSTSASISYAPLGTVGGNVQVIANGTNGCSSNPVTLPVNRTPIVPAVIPPTCVNVGLAGTAMFSIASPQPGMCYTWTFSSAFSSTTTATGTSVTIPTLGNTVGSPFAYSVSANNCAAPFCGPVSTTGLSFPVAYTTSIGLANIAVPPSQAINATPGQSSYSLWNCNTSSVQAGPQAGSTFNLQNAFLLNGYSYSVNITTLNGCVERPACVTTNYSAMVLNGGGTDAEAQGNGSLLDDGSGVIISPNPNQGRFNITLLKEVQEATAVLFNSAGQQVGKPKRLTTGNNRIGEEGLAPGVYLVRMTLDGETVTRQVAVKEE